MAEEELDPHLWGCATDPCDRSEHSWRRIAKQLGIHP
jgi:hypothetical protein